MHVGLVPMLVVPIFDSLPIITKFPYAFPMGSHKSMLNLLLPNM